MQLALAIDHVELGMEPRGIIVGNGRVGIPVDRQYRWQSLADIAQQRDLHREVEPVWLSTNSTAPVALR